MLVMSSADQQVILCFQPHSRAGLGSFSELGHTNSFGVYLHTCLWLAPHVPQWHREYGEILVITILLRFIFSV